MAILITGGMGSLGSYLARGLITKGYSDIVLFDAHSQYQRLGDLVKKVKVVSGDINDWTDIAGTIEKHRIREIFHLAAILSSEAMEKPLRAFKINLEGTVNILEASRLFGIQKVIFISSVSTYGPGLPEPVDENQRQQPTNIYGITKLASELWGIYYHQHYNIDFRAVRFPRIVNAGRTGTGVGLFPSRMIEDAARGRSHEVEVGEDYQIPIIYIKDGVDLLLALFMARDVETRVYNVNGLIPKAKEIVEAIRKHIPDASIGFSSAPTTPHLEIPIRYDDAKAREELGWRISYPLHEMVRDFIDEIRSGPMSGGSGTFTTQD
jgi:nucleoside-diphosphate-sugar epimerase